MMVSRGTDIRLPAKGNPESHGAMPVHQIISRIKWIRTSRLSIKNSLSLGGQVPAMEEKEGELREASYGKYLN